MKILVGSKNPVKVAAAKEAFEKYYGNCDVLGIEVESGIPAQPINEETFMGAENRAKKLFEINKEQNLSADFFVGIEGGIIKIHNTWFGYGGMCIIDKNKNIAFGSSPHFELPDTITKQLINRRELGDVMDEIMKVENSKYKNGAIGFFTNGVMDRKDLYLQGMIVALVPFQHKNFIGLKMNEIKLISENLQIISTNKEDPSLKEIQNSFEELNYMSEVKTYPVDLPEVIIFKIIKDEKTIGEIKLSKLRWFNRKAEIGIIIGDEFQNKGFGPEALKKIIEFAFFKMNLHRLEAELIEDNLRSKKMIEKLGFVKEGDFREAKYSNGKYLNIYKFGLLKNDYKKLAE